MRFQVDCDQCGEEFPSETKLWPNYDEKSKKHDLLQLVYNPTGFHEVWHCSEKCQDERITELQEEIKKDYGTTCSTCPAKVGKKRMNPCWTCKKLVCKDCSKPHNCPVTGWGHWCSTDCKPERKKCKVCNREQDLEEPETCDNCQAKGD